VREQEGPTNPPSPRRPLPLIAHPEPTDKATPLSDALDDLRAFVRDAARDGATFHDFEHGLWQRLLRLGHHAVGQFLDAQGTGDLGATVTPPDGPPWRRLEQPHDRELTSVFGTFTRQRTGYGSREGQKIAFVPRDNRLALPAGQFRYRLQDWDLLLATEHPFAQVAAVLQRILGLGQHVESLERLRRQAAVQVEPFRRSLPAPPAAEEGELLVQSADGKGVPLRRPADAPPLCDHDRRRGPKKDRKKKAIVGAVYTVDRSVRTPEPVLEALFRAAEQPRPEAARPRPCPKRVCARRNDYTGAQGKHHDGLAEVFGWLTEQRRDRDPGQSREVVSVRDGEESLWEAQELFQGQRAPVQVLDRLHVTPRLWQAARLFHPPDSDEALALVRARVLRSLRGEVGAVVRGLRQMGRQRGLRGPKARELATLCNYLAKHRERMRYNEYLAQGYPIASGVIEGACRHYVKDRMERTGMSWVQVGAQAMLELRSTALNGDWDEFMGYRRERETERLYPQRHTLESVSWPMAV
jgi:hypothetical protein